MKEVTYEDEKGRLWLTLLPEDALDSDASLGLAVGPPSLEDLGLPEDVEVRLHNQLYHRRIFSMKEAMTRKLDIQGAIQAVLKLDIFKVCEIYRNAENGYNMANDES